jgi:hypothetical protein
MPSIKINGATYSDRNPPEDLLGACDVVLAASRRQAIPAIHLLLPWHERHAANVALSGLGDANLVADWAYREFCEAGVTGDLQTIHLLIAGGLHQIARGNLCQDSALHAMVFGNCIAGIKALLAAGMDPDTANSAKVTILHAMAAVGNLMGVSQLLSSKASTGVRDFEGCTPLHRAVDTKLACMQVVAALVAAGADLAAKTDADETPLDIARRQGNHEVAGYLALMAASAARPPSPNGLGSGTSKPRSGAPKPGRLNRPRKRKNPGGQAKSF